jgi:Transposase IS200 like
MARVYGERKRKFTGQSFWTRGYFVSTVGRDEEVIRDYIRHQEREDERLEQLGLWRLMATVLVAPRVEATLATPFSRFERLTILKSPGFAGEWLFS